MIGRVFSHYRIEEQIGAGGMGLVYRARDLHLERDVALKLLPADLLSDEGARQRFRREALALSRLEHGHISTVHDFDADEGVQFLVMELVRGTTLAEKLADGPLPENEVIILGLQIAGALQAAHQAGVLHRDLKPANIMVTHRGEAKVMDFGLARRFGAASEFSATATATAAHDLAGTLAYMAPELLAGRAPSVRSDLYSLGATLFEMATGRRPHEESQTFALANAIMNEDAPRPRVLRPQVSPGLEAILLKCLARDPSERYANLNDLIADLHLPPTSTAVVAGRGLRHLALGVTAGLAVAALLAVAMALDLGGLRPRFGAPTMRSIAVLPLADLSKDPEQEYFADAMTAELITALAQLDGINVISRASVMGYKNTRKSPRQIARELHVQTVLEASVMRAGPDIRINAQLLDARSQRLLWAQSYQRRVVEILALQNEVALAVAGKVRAIISPRLRDRLAHSREVDPAAHEAYLKGRYHLSKNTAESARRAIEYFQSAIDADPTFAAAYSGLSDTYAQLSSVWLPTKEAMSRARGAAQRALELDPDLASAEASLGYVRAFYDWEWKDAESHFRRAIELNPSEPNAHATYAYLLMVQRRFEEAARELRRADEIDPLSQFVDFMQLWPLFETRRYEQAIAAAEAQIREHPEFGLPYLVLGQSRVLHGDYERGIRDLERGYEISRLVAFKAWVAFSWARAGDRDRARAVYRDVQRSSDTSYVQPYFFALMHAGLEEKDEAFSWLERAVEARSEELVFIALDPGMDALRSDPRFDVLVRRVGLEP